ncbi:MAG TPA: prolipoprotein diacylglyceryl transferase family protein [Acidimicrobiia bacterium]|jgi:prolipoprotein diacylglyceryltransferase|nr:prolipoprotein diacylglyceryl transferase family protein [Acidimicrobiia bacterium]
MIAGISYPPIPIFELGPLNLSLHGLFAGIGFVVGAVIMVREARRRGFDTDKISSVLTWALVASILGARFFTVPAHIGDPGYGFDDAINLAGDYSILGGYAGGILIGALRMRMLRLQVPVTLDMAAAGLAMGAVIGRIGDLAIVEHLGSATDFFLGYTITPGDDVSPQHDILECTVEQAIDGICGTYHHTALYDLVGAAILFGVILWLRRNWATRHYGQLFSFWAIWYGLQRFFIDFTRLGAARDGVELNDGRVVEAIADSVMGPFTGSQWGALAVSAIGVLLFLLWRRNPVVSADQDAIYQAESAGEPLAIADADAGADAPIDGAQEHDPEQSLEATPPPDA